jgi:hypothetical protein
MKPITRRRRSHSSKLNSEERLSNVLMSFMFVLVVCFTE